MIVDSMNLSEVIKEIQKDKWELSQLINAKLIHPKYRRYFVKQRVSTYHAFDPIFLKTSRHNTYMLTPYGYGKQNYKAKGLFYSLYNYHWYNKQFRAVLLDAHDNPIIFISAHLLERYAERFLNIECTNYLSVLSRYSLHNSRAAFVDNPSKKYNFGRFGQTLEGIILGDINEDLSITIGKTFITTDMLWSTEANQNKLSAERLNDWLTHLKSIKEYSDL